MLKIYDPFEQSDLSEKINEIIFDRCRYYASDLTGFLNCEIEEIERAIKIAERACMSLGIPIKHNFKKIYRVKSEGIEKDWKLSELACFLVVLNSDLGNPCIARAQISFAIKYSNEPD